MPSEDEQARDITFLRGPEVPNKRRYHLLAEILPPPPNVPLPAEPPFDANELFKLTYGNKLPKFLVQVDEFTQTEQSEFEEVASLRARFKQLKRRVEEFPYELEYAKQMMNLQQDSAVRDACCIVHRLAQTRLDHLKFQYEEDVERVRAACRSQLADALAALSGVSKQSSRKEIREHELLLTKRISELEEQLQQKFMDIGSLRTQLDQLDQNKRVVLESKTTTAVATRVTPVDRIESSVQTIQAELQAPPEHRNEAEAKLLIDLQDQIASLKHDLEQTQKQIETTRSQRETLESRMVNETAETRRLMKEKSALEQKVTSLQQYLVFAEKKASDLSSVISSLKEKLLQKENLQKTTDAEMTQLKKMSDALKEENEKLVRIADGLKRERSDCELQRTQLQSTLEAQRAALKGEQSLCTELRRLRKELTETRHATERRVSQLHQRLRAVAAENAVRRQKEAQVRKLHAAAIMYANENPLAVQLIPPPISTLTDTKQVSARATD